MAHKPWFYETSGPAFFNEWTWTHFAWGVASWMVMKSKTRALVAHTVYEFIEGDIFPAESRDTSFENHLGDTAAFFAGSVVAELLSPTRE